MRNTWIELDLGVLKSNIGALRGALSPGTDIILVVKANAYGHGMVPVARQAWDCGVKRFAVVHIDEALELREALPDAWIIIIGVMNPADAGTAIGRNFVPVVVSEAHALALAAEATVRRKTLRCHAKIDTGMGRLGFAWEEAARQLPALARRGGLEIGGICTHFASSDSPGALFTEIQLDRFRNVVSACEAAGLSLPFKHASNSGAILEYAESDFDAVRAGILIYGYGHRRGPGCRVPTRPFLQWKTRLVQVKRVPGDSPVSYGSTYMTPGETTVGILDVGYSDGYSRLLSNKGFVIVGGKRAPVAGRVTMNLTAVDLGPGTNAKEGDEVVLLGAQGDESVWADEMAGWRGTIPYEVLTNIRTDDRRLSAPPPVRSRS